MRPPKLQYCSGAKYYTTLTQTHKGKQHSNKIKIFNIRIQNKLQGAKAQKQGKQETPPRTPLVTHILDRPIYYYLYYSYIAANDIYLSMYVSMY
jgi:hypothetical protein